MLLNLTNRCRLYQFAQIGQQRYALTAACRRPSEVVRTIGYLDSMDQGAKRSKENLHAPVLLQRSAVSSIDGETSPVGAAGGGSRCYPGLRVVGHDVLVVEVAGCFS